MNSVGKGDDRQMKSTSLRFFGGKQQIKPGATTNLWVKTYGRPEGANKFGSNYVRVEVTLEALPPELVLRGVSNGYSSLGTIGPTS